MRLSLHKALGLSISSVILLLAGCSSDNQKSDTPCHNVFLVEPVEIGVASSRSYPATVEEARNISVGFKTAGQIERLLVKEGDHVHAGQLLAVLDTVDYALGVRQLREQYQQQCAEFERRTKMHNTRQMSDNDYEKTASGLRQLKLQLDLNENKLRYCRLYAPTSGVVTKRNFEISEMVDAGTPVFELMDNNHLEVNVDLPVDAYRNRADFSGFTGFIPSQPDRVYRLNMLSLTPKADNNQLYRLKLTVADRDSHLTPGMNLTVNIQGSAATENRNSSFEIPASAIIEKEGASGVWRFNDADSTITFLPVVIEGYIDNGRVRCSGAIPSGARIVKAGVHHVIEGEKVNVISTTSGTNPGNIL